MPLKLEPVQKTVQIDDMRAHTGTDDLDDALVSGSFPQREGHFTRVNITAGHRLVALTLNGRNNLGCRPGFALEMTGHIGRMKLPGSVSKEQGIGGTAHQALLYGRIRFYQACLSLGAGDPAP